MTMTGNGNMLNSYS